MVRDLAVPFCWTFPSNFWNNGGTRGRLFHRSPVKLLHDGRFAKVPFISGNQLDEGTVFVNGTVSNTEQDNLNWVTAHFPGLTFGISNAAAVRTLLKYYPTSQAAGSPYNTGNETFGQGSQYERFGSVVNNIAFQAPRRDHLTTATRFGVNTWSYMMVESPVNFYSLYGISHGEEILFVMQTASITKPGISTGAKELQETIGDYWINFAHTLKPNHGGKLALPYWPHYGRERKTMRFLSSNITTFKDVNRTAATDFISNPDLYK
ncbi:Carboxylesterase family [Ceratobasidium sp. AG-Ba]|nr:Carboxylesterase family [Ceratobasidium sp. AG-Ba]